VLSESSAAHSEPMTEDEAREAFKFGSVVRVWCCKCGHWNGSWPWCGSCSLFRWNHD
jgi:hypothetical protein